MDFQVQVTVTRENRGDLPAIIDFSAKAGAKALNVFFLVCTGRGQNMTDLGPEEYEEVLNYLAAVEKSSPHGMMVRARCAPHFLRVVSMHNPENSLLKGNTSGCIAGTGYLRISPEGYVTPCRYMPPSNGSSNLGVASLKDIWSNDHLFRSLREPVYNGKCAQCEFDRICGGCRARALATSNDAMGEDPWCAHIPKEGKKDAAPVRPVWTDAAQERLSNIPSFLRPMIRSGLERYAKAKGISEITPEIMAELKNKAGVQGLVQMEGTESKTTRSRGRGAGKQLIGVTFLSLGLLNAMFTLKGGMEPDAFIYVFVFLGVCFLMAGLRK